jgi:hypothetical protein
VESILFDSRHKLRFSCASDVSPVTLLDAVGAEAIVAFQIPLSTLLV